jgi:hypothetical protein
MRSAAFAAYKPRPPALPSGWARPSASVRVARGSALSGARQWLDFQIAQLANSTTRAQRRTKAIACRSEWLPQITTSWPLRVDGG